jgi:hypothetical protein
MLSHTIGEWKIDVVDRLQVAGAHARIARVASHTFAKQRDGFIDAHGRLERVGEILFELRPVRPLVESLAASRYGGIRVTARHERVRESEVRAQV